MLSIYNFESQLSSDALKKGKDYFKAGCVENIEYENNIWTAEVEGTDIYEVEVALDTNAQILNTDCDCPHDATYCKHIIAVFYAIQKELVIKIKNPSILSK